MKQRGILTVVSGFAGSGKGTVMKALLSKYDYGLSISATTRSPRPGEEHGREYFFLTREQFESMIKGDQLIEYAEYVGNYYGTPRQYVEEQLEQGRNVILEIEVQGALKVKEKYPDTLLLFLTPPSADELKARLVGRGTEDASTIAKRMERAAKEAEMIEKYDYLVVNDQVERCVEEVNRIITSRQAAVSNNMELVAELTEELVRMASESGNGEKKKLAVSPDRKAK
ncbi:MAG: guanylate kinase [Clostridiales bacterium]|nr:guanylate kinase [Clostridiales bacterium]